MPRKRKRAWSKVIDVLGVRVRLYERPGGACVYFSYRDDQGRKVQRRTKRSNRLEAEQVAREVVREQTKDRLMGRSASPTLGEVLKLWALHKAPRLKPSWKKAGDTRRDLFVKAWGADLRVEDLGQHHVDGYSGKRRRGELSPFKRTDEKGKDPALVTDGTVAADLAWLAGVFNFARRFKVNGRRVLTVNPLHDCNWPREKNPKHPVASHDRYLRTMAKADTVDPQGRLRCALALARHTGRRESAILGLRVSDVLRTTNDVRATLAALGQDERRADLWPQGAIRWRAESDKGGRDLVAPLNSAARSELEHYLRSNPRVGEAYLFPAPQNGTKPLRRDLAGRWLLRAERAAELPKLAGGRWHLYRRLWATERKDLPDADVAAAGGWKDTRALKASYQHSDAETMLRVVEGRA